MRLRFWLCQSDSRRAVIPSTSEEAARARAAELWRLSAREVRAAPCPVAVLAEHLGPLMPPSADGAGLAPLLRRQSTLLSALLSASIMRRPLGADAEA